jgi:large subunit ribosomal protein L21
MTYAVISDRGRQYTVKPGQRVRLDLLAQEPGAKVVFDRVLFFGGGPGGDAPVAGAPTVEGATVEATVVRHAKDKKIVVFKIRRRKGYRRKQGHRQGFTEVVIDAVNGAGGEARPAENAPRAGSKKG